MFAIIVGLQLVIGAADRKGPLQLRFRLGYGWRYFWADPVYYRILYRRPPVALIQYLRLFTWLLIYMVRPYQEKTADLA